MDLLRFPEKDLKLIRNRFQENTGQQSAKQDKNAIPQLQV